MASTMGLPRITGKICLVAVAIVGGVITSGCVSQTSSNPSIRLLQPCGVASRLSLGCARTTTGAVVAGDDQDARRIAKYADIGETRFQRYFGRRPLPYVFVSGTGAKTKQLLETVNRPVELAWPSAVQRSSSTTLRRGIEASLAGSNLSPIEKEEAVRQGISQAGLKTLDQEAAHDAIAVPHELGHHWFHHAYWPLEDPSAIDRYVSPAPDWLDEGAAQLMEGSGDLPFDRKNVMQALRGEASIRKGTLAVLLVQDHPGQKLKKLQAGKPPSAGWTMDELESMGIEPVDVFYARSAALVDFLITYTKDERILDKIARSYRQGQPFAIGLKINGTRYGLGTTLNELEVNWLNWLRLQPTN